jgi:hypothetical protein
MWAVLKQKKSYFLIALIALVGYLSAATRIRSELPKWVSKGIFLVHWLSGIPND